MGLVELPHDILLLILRKAYYLRKADSSSEHQPDNRTLRSCALVHSVWRQPAQSVLFKSVVCKPSFVNTFLKKDTTSRSSELLRHIRILDFSTPVYLDNPKDFDAFGETIELALQRCSSLYEIVLRGAGSNAFSDKVLSDIRERASSNTSPIQLRSLRVHWRSPTTGFPYRLASCFQSLQFLSITVYDESGHRLNTHAHPPIETLEGLSLFELRLSGTPDSALRMLSQAPPSLQVLELPSIPNTKFLELLQPHCSNLRSVRLKCFTRLERSFIKSCPELRELILHVDGRDPVRIPKTLPSLKHIIILFSWGSFGQNSNALRRSGSSNFIASLSRAVEMNTLQSLQLRGMTWNIKPRDLSALQEVSKEKGVDVQVNPNASWPDEMCVKAPSFPRRRSFSNFTLMNQ